MRTSGKIININEKTGWGTIIHNYRNYIKFNIIDIHNISNNIRKGQKVSFDLVMESGTKRAINIYLEGKLDNKNDINKFVKYNYENWEEVERLVDGDYVNKATAVSKPISTDNKLSNLNYLALGLFENKIKIISLAKDDEYSFLDQSQKYHHILYPSFIEEVVLELAIEEFEDLLNNAKASEDDFQNFFERNPDFILNDEYKKAHPHIILAKDDKRKLIPDFVLEPVNQGGFCDLLELKLPSAPLYVMKKSREHYSAAITEAAAQLRTYGNYFNEEKNRNSFQQTYPYLKIYKPRMFVVIGRQTNENFMVKREIQAEHPQLILKSFDDVLARMKWKKEKMESRNKLFR